MEQINKTLEDYKRLPYTLRTEPVKDSDGSLYWTAEYLELQGCKTDGASELEAVENLYELFDEYISARIEQGGAIPEPEKLQHFEIAPWIIIRKKNASGEEALKISEETEETKGEFEELAARIQRWEAWMDSSAVALQRWNEQQDKIEGKTNGKD